MFEIKLHKYLIDNLLSVDDELQDKYLTIIHNYLKTRQKSHY